MDPAYFAIEIREGDYREMQKATLSETIAIWLIRVITWRIFSSLSFENIALHSFIRDFPCFQ